MALVGVFSKGRPSGHPAATSILRYIPRPRVPWQPSRFGRENLTEEDLKQMWGRGRYRDGPGNYNSGYSTEKSHILEDHTVNMIPKHELEKYMPDISIGPKALVTPVSLMAARGGHRVTHDLLHSYDPYIGRLQKSATVDHDNITVEDPNRVGLNAATLDCRGRIYRWLRRGPFFQEDHYFRRGTQLQRNGEAPVSVHEAPLMKKIVRLARRGHLKAACEEYRRVTSVPPVEVYRALTAACVPDAKLADAISIFEDGNTRLFYVARDGEVLGNLMRCAIRAKHRVRVMWVYNVMRGRYYENVVVRAEVGPVWRYRIAALALEFLLDQNAAEEAKAVYEYLVSERLIDCDVYARVGKLMQEALAEGKTIHMNEEVFNGVALVRNAELVAPLVASTVFKRYCATLQESGSAAWASHAPVADPAGLSPEQAVQWLRTHFSDIDPLAVMRLARYEDERKDLMVKDRPLYAARAALWLELLSTAHQVREEAPLTYLRKSRPSLTNANVRVAWLPDRRRPTQLLANEEGYSFAYTPQTRFVEETFTAAGETLHSRYLAQIPLHQEVPASISLGAEQPSDHLLPPAFGSTPRLSPYTTASAAAAPRVLHASVLDELQRTVPGTVVASTASGSEGSLVSPGGGGGGAAARGGSGSGSSAPPSSPFAAVSGDDPHF